MPNSRLALFTLLSNAAIVLCQTQGQVTTLAMPFFWPEENPVPVVADILGVGQDDKTTYLLHDDRTGPTTFSADGLGGTMTYILGPGTASIRYVFDEGATSMTAIGDCTFTSANVLNSPATCTLSVDGTLTTQTETLTAARVTIGTVEPTATIQTSIPGTSQTSTPTPGSTVTTTGPAQTTSTPSNTNTNTPAPSKTGASVMNVVSMGTIGLSSMLVLVSCLL